MNYTDILKKKLLEYPEIHEAYIFGSYAFNLLNINAPIIENRPRVFSKQSDIDIVLFLPFTFDPTNIERWNAFMHKERLINGALHRLYLGGRKLDIWMVEQRHGELPFEYLEFFFNYPVYRIK